MLTDLDREFTDQAGRLIWARADNRTCMRVIAGAACSQFCDTISPWCETHHREAGVKIGYPPPHHEWPEVPRWHELEAATLLGRVLEHNHVASIDAIAGAIMTQATLGDDDESECVGCRAVFFRAIVIEYLGGAKVADTFGKIHFLPAPHLSCHELFSVPERSAH